MIEILIPTCRQEVTAMLAAINQHTPDCRVIASCLDQSAARNRNWCLGRLGASADVAIMLDDDISGFYPGWSNDLVRPMVDPLVCMVSARLITPDGLPAFTAAGNYDSDSPTVDIEIKPHQVLPTAAIAFRSLGVRFDEEFLGSGWEDNDWCMQYRTMNPRFRFVQSNECQLVHANEQKRQTEFWKHNKLYFVSKWLGREHGLIRA